MLDSFRSPNAPVIKLSAAEARTFASDLIRNWPSDELIDAAHILDEHPHLREFKSVIIDFAYEEYYSRIDNGESIDPDSFARKFPEAEQSIKHLLVADNFVGQNFKPTDDATVIWPQIGDTFANKFKLVEELGRGAFSRVFLAHEIGLGHRVVVVKICKKGAWEADILGRVEHPLIGRVHSVLTDPISQLNAICMPFQSRATLLDVLDSAWAYQKRPKRARAICDAVRKANRGLVDETKSDSDQTTLTGSYVTAVIRIGIQLAEALAYSHSKMIVHCDLKPSNVLMTGNGQSLLFDFNLSLPDQMAESNIGGTIPYMAPECLRAIAAESSTTKFEPGAHVDIYSLGATLFQLLTGRLPYGDIPRDLTRTSLAQQLLERQERRPDSMQAFNPEVSFGLQNIIERCLAFEPAMRFASASELAIELRKELKPLRAARSWMHANPIKSWTVTAALVLASFVGINFAATVEDRQIAAARQAVEDKRWDDAIVLIGNLPEQFRYDPEMRNLFEQARFHADQSQVDAAYQAAQNESWEEAIVLFEKLRKYFSSNPELQFELAPAQLHAGHNNEGLLEFADLDGRVQDARFSSYFGFVLLKYGTQRHARAAIYALLKARDLGDRGHLLYENLGHAYMKASGEEEPARRAYVESFRLHCDRAANPEFKVNLDRLLDVCDKAMVLKAQPQEIRKVARNHYKELLLHPQFIKLLEDRQSKRVYPKKAFNPLGEIWKPFRFAPQQTNLMVRG